MVMENQFLYMLKSTQSKNYRSYLLLLGILVASVALPSEQSMAHGFGERYDLPLPLPLFIKTAGQIIALTFLLMIVFVKRPPSGTDYPKMFLNKTIIGRILTSIPVVFACQTLSITFFLTVVISGYLGVQDPNQNIAVVAVWVIAWVGLAYVSTLFGNIWKILNPWSILFSSFEKLLPKHKYRAYPTNLGKWPAAIIFLAFAWMEIAWEGGRVPLNIAITLTFYSTVTWAGMYVFSKKKWLQNGEVFSVIFNLFSHFSIIGQKKPELNRPSVCLRPPVVGLISDQPQPFSMVVFVLIFLSTVTYDGFVETALWNAITLVLTDIFKLSTPFLVGVGMIFFAIIFITTYMAFITMMALIIGQKENIFKLAGLFIFSIVPIAIAYHLSHYFSLLLTNGQLIISRISDPLGFGWDLFGSAGHQFNIGLIAAGTIWYSSITAIIIGHIASLYLAHITALNAVESSRKAIFIQIPMTILMIGYTMISLWIIAQPIIA